MRIHLVHISKVININFLQAYKVNVLFYDDNNKLIQKFKNIIYSLPNTATYSFVLLIFNKYFNNKICSTKILGPNISKPLMVWDHLVSNHASQI